ncbi:MAG: carbon-nitrogen hydrolase family protein [Chlorobium sp.]|nr:MAG: carbon-nitrogen hydrolase family protein [Chlorobium sp.]
MKKVANFINHEYYREALARLCRIAQRSAHDERLVLDDWEKLHLSNYHSSEEKAHTIKQVMERFGNDAFIILSDEIEKDPLLWFQAVDEHCNRIFGPDSILPHDKIDDGDGESIVLPIYPGFGGGKRREQYGNTAFWLKHHRVIPLNAPLSVAEIPQGYKDWATQHLIGEMVKIAIIHFADGSYPITRDSSIQSFVFNDLSDEAIRLEKALECIRAAKSEGAHILVMPELTITPVIRLKITNKLDLLNEKEGENHALSVPVIVLGSFHEQVEMGLRNHAEAILGLDGTYLFGCDKRRSVTFNNCREGIECASTPLTCLLTPLGLMAMAICKDMFDGKPAAALSSLSPDWLLVPSMSEKLNPHRAAAKQLHDTGGTVVAVANQEMPGIKGYDPGFVHHEEREDCTTDMMFVTVARKDNHLRRIK